MRSCPFRYLFETTAY